MTQERALPRQQAAAKAAARHSRRGERPMDTDGRHLATSEYFGSSVFGFELMEKKLPAADVAFLREFATKHEPLSRELADKVAKAVKNWAIERGASHYCHWFQPQTGATAEKHDSFLSFDGKGNVIESFTGRELIQGEPDASSFPSGGVRATFEARGYTAWDASSPMFLMEAENGLTLCIPTLFISYTGEALDEKTPLLRSIATLSDKAVQALALLGEPGVKYVTATAGPEQEYFLIDEALHALRPDLMLAGRTLCGRTPPRHQQLEDHYFGAIKPRVLNFMMECETTLYRLGVPVKTRHNEVAPAQCETAPIFEHANIAADHNQLIMEVLKTVAKRHQMVALFHEKPYAGINGSGKHVNWSMADADGHNLLEPGDKPHDNLRFLYFLAAVLKAVHDHGDLLRMAVATPGNDFRLGANEAPPAIISVFLGETLTEVLDRLVGVKQGEMSQRLTQINLDLAKVPVVRRDNTDRNRTSPFAFTGNKFEFRAVGASSSISMPLTFINSAVANSLDAMNRQLAASTGGGPASNEQILALVQQIVRDSSNVRFEGDNYSAQWHQEAQKRGLPNRRNTPEALQALKLDGNQSVLEQLKVMTKRESQARYNVRLERFNKIRLIELETLADMVSTQVLPTLFGQQRDIASSMAAANVFDGLASKKSHQREALTAVVTVLDNLLQARSGLVALLNKAGAQHDEEALAKTLAEDGMRLMTEVRALCNEAEGLVDDVAWPLPKYHEMLYLL